MFPNGVKKSQETVKWYAVKAIQSMKFQNAEQKNKNKKQQK